MMGHRTLGVFRFGGAGIEPGHGTHSIGIATLKLGDSQVFTTLGLFLSWSDTGFIA